MSYSEADAELWDTDPYEYIRIKFDIFEVTKLISETSRKFFLGSNSHHLESIVNVNGSDSIY